MNKILIKKLFIVVVGVVLFRLGSHIPVPGIDPIALNNMFQNYSGTLLDMFDVFSGGSLKRLSIFAIGVMPFISASIVMQMFGYYNTHLKQLKEEGAKGQIKLAKYTRYLTLFIGTIQGFFLTSTLQSQTVEGMNIVINSGLYFQITAILTLLAGTMTIVWIGEKITEHGIGNGLSLIIYSSIISGLPTALSGTYELYNNGDIGELFILGITLFIILAVYFVVKVENGQRRISVNYSGKQNTGFHGNKGFLPFKINMAGIIPPIIASTIILIPATLIAGFSENSESEIILFLNQVFAHGSVYFLVIFSSLILFFSFFFAKLQQEPDTISKRLKDSGTFIKGIPPGAKTTSFISKTINNMALIGGLYLVTICLIPELLIKYWGVPFYFGGTSLLILVLVGIDWEKKISIILNGNNYKKIENKLMDNFNKK